MPFVSCREVFAAPTAASSLQTAAIPATQLPEQLLGPPKLDSDQANPHRYIRIIRMSIQPTFNLQNMALDQTHAHAKVILMFKQCHVLVHVLSISTWPFTDMYGHICAFRKVPASQLVALKVNSPPWWNDPCWPCWPWGMCSDKGWKILGAVYQSIESFTHLLGAPGEDGGLETPEVLVFISNYSN